jgi:peptidoglycan hydrolase-like protein with peptidoglycan-binding domain
VKRPTLKERDSGTDVRYLQKLLGIEADGKFGPATKTAVKAVRKKNKLKADGIAGGLYLGRAREMSPATRRCD